MLTSKWHQKEENFFTLHFRSLKCIRFAENNLFLLRTMGKGGGREFKTMSLLGPQDILTGPNWHNAQLDHVFYKIQPVRIMFGVSSIVPNINTERVKGILWHPGMKSTCIARAHPARHQATGDLIRQWRRTVEHLRVPLLFARDNPGCDNDVI